MSTNLTKNPLDNFERLPGIKKPEVLNVPQETDEMETTPETVPSAPEQQGVATEAAQKIKGLLPRLKKTPSIPAAKDVAVIKIEKIMEEDLGDIYQTLSPIAKQEFKIKGEEAAGKIWELMRTTHVKAKKIFQLIVQWLKFLPGINKFFLEQEAKIKTDKILSIKK